MLRRAIHILIAACLLLIQAACIPFGDAWVSFSGHVKDAEGRPLNGAELKILFDGKPASDRSETSTNEAGEYKFFEDSCPCDFEFVVIAAKDGYRIYTKRMTGKEANNLKELEIVLERAVAASPPPKDGVHPTRDTNTLK